MIGAFPNFTDECLYLDEQLQVHLRRAVARAMQRRYYHANIDEQLHMEWNVIPPELPPMSPRATATLSEQQRHQQRRDRELRALFERAGITTFPAYAERMFYPAAGAQVAWANANYEGPYVAEIVDRPLFVINQLTPAHAVQHLYTLVIYLPDRRQFVINFTFFLTHHFSLLVCW